MQKKRRTRMVLILAAAAFISGCIRIDIDNVTQYLSVEVPKNQVQCYGNDQGSASTLSCSMDSDAATHWNSQTVSLDEEKWIAYKFASSINLSHIFVSNFLTKTYSFGDLDVMVSADSSNGLDGQWTLVKSLTAAASGIVDGDCKITVNKNAVRWIKLKMKYSGTGAIGVNPYFCISEVDFFRYQ